MANVLANLIDIDQTTKQPELTCVSIVHASPSEREKQIFQNEWPGRLVFGGPGLSAMEAQRPKSSHIFFVNGDLNRSNLILSALTRGPQQLENRGLI